MVVFFSKLGPGFSEFPVHLDPVVVSNNFASIPYVL